MGEPFFIFLNSELFDYSRTGKLSLRFHPDKNRGNEDAVLAFADIVAAMEVVGTPDKRAGEEEEEKGEEEEEEEKRMKKTSESQCIVLLIFVLLNCAAEL